MIKRSAMILCSEITSYIICTSFNLRGLINACRHFSVVNAQFCTASRFALSEIVLYLTSLLIARVKYPTNIIRGQIFTKSFKSEGTALAVPSNFKVETLLLLQKSDLICICSTRGRYSSHVRMVIRK